ncbi:MAG: acetate kinase [Chromatiales bacterium]|nr:acetate kinase [Chromatiales bacterium]
MKVLVINTGSSSIKYKLFDMTDQRALAAGLLERIGESGSHLVQRWGSEEDEQTLELNCNAADHQQGMAVIVEQMQQTGVLGSADELAAVGHRVVHGGEVFSQPVRIDQQVIDVIREMVPLAPLHNPANLEGIEVAMSLYPNVPQIGVFDTAFHQTMPAEAYRYALPETIYKKHKVRRYGFHGSSHSYVAKQAAGHLGKPLSELNLITVHLGNGCSATAIRDGCSVDTTMGMTPLEGLVMGTRCGDLDPAIHFYLEREANISPTELERLLNKESGLKGICGVGDMREVSELAAAGNAEAQLARALFIYRMKKYIGAYYAVLGRVDAIVFTGGIGENDAAARAGICADLESMGIVVDQAKNSAKQTGVKAFNGEQGAVALLVIPTDEELEIALNCKALIN